VLQTLAESTFEEVTDWAMIKEKIRTDGGAISSNRPPKRPLVLPVIRRFERSSNTGSASDDFRSCSALLVLGCTSSLIIGYLTIKFLNYNAIFAAKCAGDFHRFRIALGSCHILILIEFGEDSGP
jgi:hypothetical protein